MSAQKGFTHDFHSFRKKLITRLPRVMHWWASKNKIISLKYVSIIKDLYENVVRNVGTGGELTDKFFITKEVHQRLILILFRFALVVDKITKHIYEDIPWCMLFIAILF